MKYVEDGQTLPSSLTTDNEALGKGKRKKKNKGKTKPLPMKQAVMRIHLNNHQFQTKLHTAFVCFLLMKGECILK